MRVNWHRPPKGRRARGVAAIGATLAAVVALAGCSVGNLTGFDFPSFGLTKKAENEAPETTGSIDTPPSERKLGTQ
jgi:hypothetical protein